MITNGPSYGLATCYKDVAFYIQQWSEMIPDIFGPLATWSQMTSEVQIAYCMATDTKILHHNS